METVSSSERPGNFAILGYVAWFAFLVRLVHSATSTSIANSSESIGLYFGLSFGLFILLGIPYFFAWRTAKHRGTAISWFSIMTWTTIIAMLLTIGGLYGRLHRLTEPAQITPNASKVSAGFIEGEWRCTDLFSKAPSRLILHDDGSISGAVGDGPLIRDPWLHWYFPIQENANNKVILVRIRIQSMNNIIVQKPNNDLDDCFR